ncbi:MAG: CDP-alcohol phosphatidyltransferase family protein [Chloroflexi bacterium]|nr:CDP-alcohol phosphatidyltransferase family protein [Chloroflexota bacterium]
MFTAWLRKVFGKSLDMIAAVLDRWGVTANALTIAGCLLNVGVGVLLALGYLRLGGVLLLGASGLDGLDGTLARIGRGPTKFGAFLDSVLDRVSESALFIGLAWHFMEQSGRTEVLLAAITLVGSLLVSYTRARAEGLGLDCKVGLLTRVERCLVLFLALTLGVIGPALWILAVGTWLTALHRVLHVYATVKETPL